MSNNFSQPQIETTALMDATVTALNKGQVEEGLNNLGVELGRIRPKADFARAIPKDDISRQRLFRDELHNFIYLEIIKK